MRNPTPTRRAKAKRRTDFSTLMVRPGTKEKFRSFADLKRMDLAEAADVCVDAVGMLTREQLEALIEKRDGIPASTASA